MPLLSSSIPNLVNGVSQQAPALRLSSQMEAQENAYSSIVEGLGKRHPSHHIARLDAIDMSPGLIHTINRDSAERYTVVLLNSEVRVYGMDGVARTVATPDGTGYLSTLTPSTTMKAYTVEDYTFIVNTDTTVEMSSTASTDPGMQALVFVKQGQYGTKYTVYIDEFVAAEYTTSSSTVTDLQTTSIAETLKNQIKTTLRFVLSTATWTEGTLTLTQTNAFSAYAWTSGDRIYLTGGTGITPGTYTISSKTDSSNIVLASSPSSANIDLSSGDITSSHGWTITLQDSCISVKKNTGEDFSIRSTDSFGDRAMVAIKDSIQRFSDLPVIAPTGFLVEITGDNSTVQDNYWVKFVPNNASATFDKGVWVESVAPGITYRFDASTMPHVLLRESDGTFTFRQATWGDRSVGDLETAPNPSFVGQSIKDVFFLRNRLGMLSQANVILSGEGDFFTFFPSTVTTILDSDPIDVAATHTQAAFLQHAVPFQEELLLFAENAQFVLSSGNSLLTPSSVSIQPTTDFNASLQARPVGCGNNVYFAFQRGSFSGLWEYFIQPNSETKDAADTTGHVPKYIPGVITKLTVTSNENVVVGLSSEDRSALYLYKFYWLNNQKLQSAWSRYSLEDGCRILNADFIGSSLYLAIQRDDGCYLEYIQFEPGQVDEDSQFVTRLDRRITEENTSVVYDPLTNKTTWTLPYTITSNMSAVVRAGDEVLPEGLKITITTPTDTTIASVGDFSDTRVYIGQTYTMRVRLSEQILREEARGGGQAQITAGRSQLRYVTVTFNDTGYFSTEVTPSGRDTSVKNFTGLIPGVNGLGVVNLPKGEFPFPIFSQSSEVTIDLVSDSHLPCFFTGAEFETFYHSRSQRA